MLKKAFFIFLTWGIYFSVIILRFFLAVSSACDSLVDTLFLSKCTCTAGVCVFWNQIAFTWNQEKAAVYVHLNTDNSTVTRLLGRMWTDFLHHRLYSVTNISFSCCICEEHVSIVSPLYSGAPHARFVCAELHT